MYYRRINGVNRYFLTQEAADRAEGIGNVAERQKPVKTAKKGIKTKKAKK